MKPTKKTAKSLQSKNSDPRLSSSASTRSGSESEKVQQTLINSELRYRRLFETARDGILILDAETGTITDVNPYIAKMLGYSREEFIEKKLWEVGAFRNIKASNDGFEELQEKEYIRYDNIPLKTKDGRLVQVEFVSNVYVVGGKKVIQCNIRDITERRQAEEERILLRTIIDYIPVAVYAKDRDGRKVLANSFDLAHFNKPESEIIGHTDMELFPKEVAERTMADDLLVIRDGERIIDREELIINDAGESRWLLTSKIPWRNMEGKIIGLVGIGHDITGRKLAEEKSRKLWTSVQEEKDRLSALLNSINDEVWFADTRKKFILANLSARHEFDIKYQGEIDVETFASRLEVYHLDGSPRPIEEAAPLKALKGETVKNQEEIIRTPATGELRYRQVSASPVRVSSGNIIGSVSVVRDITESKRAEAEIKKLNAELEAFSYSVSHDLRSPLRALDGFSRILSEEYHAILDDEGKRLLTVVRSNTKRMAQLIDDLLAFSRMGRKEMVCG
ncbi:MAG: PAS domain S-box protein, partial [Candidatus Latescibacterota bacterium]